MTHYPRAGLFESIEDGAYRAFNAVLTGDVTLGRDSSVWFGCVLRGDDAPIRIGARSNVQDLTMIHADPDVVNTIGDDCTIGHRCVLHGAEVGDRVLVGMGAILLGGSRIGAESIIAAGAVVKENAVIPPRSLVVGVPGRVVRELRDDEIPGLLSSAAGYVAKVEQYLDTLS